MPVRRQSNPSVTQRDVASHCDVSVMTVSMALRGEAHNLKPETVAKVREAARVLGYDPAHSLGARRLRYARTPRRVINNLIGFYFSLRHIRGPYAERLLHAIGDVIDAAGFALLTNWTPVKEQPPVRLPAIFARSEVDGVLTISGVPHLETMVRMLRDEAGFGDRPIVSLMEELDGCTNVLVDDIAGGRALMDHLLDLGHRQVMCVDFGRWQHQQRREGCRQACRMRGLDPAAAVQLLPYNSDDPAVSRANVLGMLASHPGCRAIFAGNDATACGIHAWLTQAGYRVPQDVSIIGFDDSHYLAGPSGENLLTTVHLPLEEVGRRGVELLIGQIQGRSPAIVTDRLPVSLVVRGSTAPPPLLRP